MHTPRGLSRTAATALPLVLRAMIPLAVLALSVQPFSFSPFSSLSKGATRLCYRQTAVTVPLRSARPLDGRRRSTARLLSSVPGNDTGGEEGEDGGDEVLLRLSLSVSPTAVEDDGEALADADEAVLESVRAYACSFPFAAVLPVQPLTYLPTDDGTGVRVTFLRKKTKEKGSVDGGINFDIRWAEEVDAPEGEEEDGGGRRRIDVVARRISEGQTVSKAFSEMLVIKAFVKGILGEDESKLPDPILTQTVKVESVFHRWMQS